MQNVNQLLAFIDIAGEVETTAEGGTKGGIVAAMVIRREPDEIGCSIVGVVTIEVVALIVSATWTDPCESNKEMTIRSTFEITHPRIVGMHVGLRVEVFGTLVLHLIQSSG